MAFGMKEMYGFKPLIVNVNYLDYGGKWFRHVEGTREYYVIELLNWEDTVGEREAKEVGFKYNMSLALVDLGKMTDEQIRDVHASCGWDHNTAGMTDEWTVDAAHGYGLKAPLNDVNTNNFHKTFRELAARAKELAGNQWVKSQVMKEPCNRLGSTREEFMRGDIDSALERQLWKRPVDPAIRVMAKMHGKPVPDEVKDGAQESKEVE